jgi:hypothetical protein
MKREMVLWAEEMPAKARAEREIMESILLIGVD